MQQLNTVGSAVKSIVVIFCLSIFLVGCKDSKLSKTDEVSESKKTFDFDEATIGVEKSINGFTTALAKGDAKAAANFYTSDAVFMPYNAPGVNGRDNIEKALAQYIGAGYTKINIQSTWSSANDEFYIETEKWSLTNSKDTIIGKSLVVWKMEDGVWKQFKDMINTDIP